MLRVLLIVNVSSVLFPVNPKTIVSYVNTTKDVFILLLPRLKRNKQIIAFHAENCFFPHLLTCPRLACLLTVLCGLHRQMQLVYLSHRLVSKADSILTSSLGFN